MMHHTTCSHTRWGFRQGVASPRGTSMTFMHPNFIRGDKQRCLLMRSIVKRPPVGSVFSLRQSSQNKMALLQQQPQMGRVVVEVPTVHRCYYPSTNGNTQHAFGSSVLLRLGQQQVVFSSSAAGRSYCSSLIVCPSEPGLSWD